MWGLSWQRKIVTLVFLGDDEFISRLDIVIQRPSNVFKYHGRTRSVANLIDGIRVEEQRCSNRSLRDALGALYADGIVCAELHVCITEIINNVVDHLLGCLRAASIVGVDVTGAQRREGGANLCDIKTTHGLGTVSREDSSFYDPSSSDAP